MHRTRRARALAVAGLAVAAVAVTAGYRPYARYAATRDLVEAVSLHDVSRARLALRRGANPDGFGPCSREDRELIVDGKRGPDWRYTPLQKACAEGDSATALLLIDGGADFRTRACDGSSVLELATFCNLEDVAEVLIAQGADVNGRSGHSTPLMYAASRAHLRLIRRLLRHGARANVRDWRGWTALNYLVEGRTMEVPRDPRGWAQVRSAAAALVSAGADPLAPDDTGVTPIGYAEGSKLPKMVAVLTRLAGRSARGPSPRSTDDAGR